MFNASADLLEHLELDHHAEVVRNAIDKAINMKKVHTPDLGGQNSTTDVVQFMIEEVKAQTQI